MHLLPKELIKEAMQLPGVYQGRIDHSKFDIQKYNDLLQKILEHTRKYLTAKSMAQYMLDVLGYQGKGPVLFLANDKATDYLKICILIGLKELLSDQAIDVPRIDCIYTNFDGNSKAMYGKGFSYTRVVNDVPVNRDNIEDRIKNKEFELIIYGYTHHGLPFHDIVTQYYDQDHTAYLCGEDIHTCTFANLHNMFLREHYL